MASISNLFVDQGSDFEAARGSGEGSAGGQRDMRNQNRP